MGGSGAGEGSGAWRVTGERLERGRLARDGLGRRQVERLDHEARDLARARRSVVAGRGEDQLVARPRHRDVEEAPLLEELRVAAAQLLVDEVLRQAERIAPPLQRELALGRAHDEDGRELEALGLVHGEHVDGVVVGIGLGDRRIVAGLAQQLEVRDEGRDAVVLGHVAVGLHGLEEAGDVLDLGLGLGGGFSGEAAEQARPLEEAVEHLASAVSWHLGRGALEVGDQPGAASRAAPETEARSSFSGRPRSTSSSGRVLRRA